VSYEISLLFAMPIMNVDAGFSSLIFQFVCAGSNPYSSRSCVSRKEEAKLMRRQPWGTKENLRFIECGDIFYSVGLGIIYINHEYERIGTQTLG